MPVTSPKQFRLMEASKNGKLKNMAGPSPEVATEFLNATPHSVKSTFAKENPIHKFTMALRNKKKLRT